MIKQILAGYKQGIVGLSDNGELYDLLDGKWSHVASSPDDKEKDYIENGEWKKRIN